MIIRRLGVTRRIFSVDTQKLREKVLWQLRELFDMACGQAKNKNLDIMRREKYARVAAYTAQVMEGVAKGFDECKFNENLAKLEQLINEAQRLGKKAAEPQPQSEGNESPKGPS
jgi:hypothetical protein